MELIILFSKRREVNISELCKHISERGLFMFKKTIATALIVSTVFSSGSSIAGAATTLPDPIVGQLGIDVIVDGMKVTFPDAEPFTDSTSHTMVPVRFVSEQLGAEVLWDNKAQIATIQYEGQNIVMPVNSKVVTVDGTQFTLDTAAVMVDSRVFVPLRFVSETLGAEVKYDAGYVAVTVSSQDFLAKVASGEIKVDNYGRKLRSNMTTNLPATASEWQLLEDTENYAYDVGKPYTVPRDKPTLNAYEVLNQLKITKDLRDRIALNIKKNYQLRLNVDYRTINATVYYNTALDLYWRVGTLFGPEVSNQFVNFVKKNHVITQGYAFPEENSLYRKNGDYFMKTKYKFRVVSADDASQFSMDSWNPTSYSESPTWVIKGQWYVGYADVRLESNAADTYIETLMQKSAENMFLKGAYQYKELK
ncbi:copper amine oxidase N-terminal domain-containing protein [Cohnella fermenti]|uniref:copper amine oxidase N-terminal domain-containing protein n=1 Tax=Cohnella fermenti TaxID=2565925 RepID=UPI001454D3BC|nr:copper amine oxidase N-terminal domain-containing protein [Cohnella fermenti]